MKANLGLLLAFGLVGCGPPITDVSLLPKTITVCGWTWKHDAALDPMSLADAETLRGAKPVVVEPGSALCPVGACTEVDVRAGNLARGTCQDAIWVRVGFDIYAQYGMVLTL